MSSKGGKGSGASGGTGRYQPTATMLGIQHNKDDSGEVYDKVQEINGYRFEVPPVSRYHSKTAETKFMSLVGSMDPIRFNAERFDTLRERLQVAEKRDKDANLQAIAVLYSEYLCKAFLAAEKGSVDYAEMERMFYPTYLPTYDGALKALGLSKSRPVFWRKSLFSTLENISRLPLENCDDKKQATMSFPEFYSLLWNYYMPFNVNAYIAMVLAQSHFVNKELVDAVVEYLSWRHGQLDDSVKKNPIVFIGSRTGKLGHFINETKKLPVPVVHVHENPNTNPYLLLISPEKQPAFKPCPVIKMKHQAAIEKYQPGIVLASDFAMHQDETAMIRSHGCVREYIYFGMADTYAEGNGWDTWGYPKYRPKGENAVPPYMRDGWAKVHLHHISRWMIHKYDSEFLMGNGRVTSWVRRPIAPKFGTTIGWMAKRFAPFY